MIFILGGVVVYFLGDILLLRYRRWKAVYARDVPKKKALG